VEHERNRSDVAQTLSSSTRTSAARCIPVRVADGDRDHVDARLAHECLRFLGACQRGSLAAFARDVVHASDRADLAFDGDAFGRACLTTCRIAAMFSATGRVEKSSMTEVYPGDALRHAVERVAVVEVQRGLHAELPGDRARDRACARAAAGRTRRPVHQHHGAAVARHAQHHRHALGVPHVKTDG